MHMCKVKVLANCSSRTLPLFTRNHVPRVSLSQTRILLSSWKRKPSDVVATSQLLLGSTVLKGKVGILVPVIAQAYHTTKPRDPALPGQVQLNQKIISLKTVEDQLKLYESVECPLNVVNRVSLLYNIAKIVRRNKKQMQVLRQIRNESNVHVLNGAYVKLLDSISADISRCFPRCLANVMWSLGNIKEENHCLLQSCEDKIVSCDMSSFTQPDIFQIVKGCSLLGTKRMKLFLKLEEAILNGGVAISEFKDHDLTLVVVSFAKDGSGSETLFNFFQSEILSRNLMTYDSHQLAGFVWAFAKRRQSCLSELFEQIENEVLRRGASTMQSVPMSMLLSSFAKVGMGSESLFSAFDSELVTRGLQTCDNTGLVQIMWSFAKRGIKDAGVYNVVENEVLQRGMSAFQNHQLVVLLWSFIKAEKCDAELVKIASDEFLQRDVKQLQGDHLSQLVWTLGRARIKNSELFDSIEQVITQCRPLKMKSFEIIALMRGYVEAKEGSSELFDYLRCEIIRDIETLSGDEISEVLWCFSEGKVNTPALFSAIEKEIHFRGIESFNTTQLKKIKQCFLTVGEGSEELFELLKNVDIEDKEENVR